MLKCSIIILIILFNIYIVDKEFAPYININKKEKLIYLMLSFCGIFFMVLDKQIYFIPISFLLFGNLIIDIKNKELSTILNVVLSIEGIIYVVFSNNINHIRTAFILYFIYLFISIISNESLGRGDVDLIFGIGLFINSYNLLKLLIYPFLISSIYSLILLFFKKNKKYEFPFSPFIIVSFYIIMFI